MVVYFIFSMATIADIKGLLDFGVISKSNAIRLGLQAGIADPYTQHQISINAIAAEFQFSRGEIFAELAVLSGARNFRQRLIEGRLPGFQVTWAKPSELPDITPERCRQMKAQGMFRDKGALYFALSADNPAKQTNQTADPKRLVEFYGLTVGEIFEEVATLTSDKLLVTTIDELEIRWLQITAPAFTTQPVETVGGAIASLLTRIQFLENRPQSIQELKTLYFSADVGSDQIGDGSLENPRKSIQGSLAWILQNFSVDYPAGGRLTLQLLDSSSLFGNFGLSYFPYPITIKGNQANPSATKINTQFNAISVNRRSSLFLQDVEIAGNPPYRLNSGGVRGANIVIGQHAHVTISNCIFNTLGSDRSHIVVGGSGFLDCSNNTIRGGTNNHIEMTNGTISVSGGILENNPTFQSWIKCLGPGDVLMRVKPTGTVTGRAIEMTNNLAQIFYPERLPDSTIA